MGSTSIDKKKIAVVIGTRPEGIKMCPIIKKLLEDKAFKVIVCVTGQHKEMLKEVMSTFKISEDYNFEIMKEGQTLEDITVKVMHHVRSMLEDEHPDAILVHGDTTSAFAAGLEAFYMNIPVYHVEAGLRSYDVHEPFPEEFNRKAIDIFSSLFFAPTSLAKENLLREGVTEEQVYITGNTGIDALNTTIKEHFSNPILEKIGGGKYILLTIHRRESQGEVMRKMFEAIKECAEDNRDVNFVFPVHKNPKVRELAEGILKNTNNIILCEPLDVNTFHNLLARCFFIVTDSGGIQEEASYLGKPVLVLRNKTERPEGALEGPIKIVGTKKEKIKKEISLLLKNNDEYRKLAKKTNVYGDGHSSERIVDIIKEYLQIK